MFRFLNRSAALALAAGCITLASAPVIAQYLRHPTAGLPRTPDGKYNPSAPAPRTADGKPDFTGIWLTDNPACNPDPETNVCGVELPMGKDGINIGQSLPGGLPYQPWLAAKVKERTANDAKDDPHVRCFPDTFIRGYSMPHMLKFVQTPQLFVMLNEMNTLYRQIFTDGRALPEDPNPTWMGYSVGRWDGDTLVIDSNGLRDDTWIDWNGSVVTDQAKVREEIRRPTFGTLEVKITVDDSKAYTRPWTVTLREKLAINTELMDEFCVENEQSSQRMNVTPGR